MNIEENNLIQENLQKTNKNKIFKTIGVILVIIGIYGFFRYKEINDISGLLSNLSVIGVYIGLLLTIIPRNKEKIHEEENSRDKILKTIGFISVIIGIFVSILYSDEYGYNLVTLLISIFLMAIGASLLIVGGKKENNNNNNGDKTLKTIGIIGIIIGICIFISIIRDIPKDNWLFNIFIYLLSVFPILIGMRLLAIPSVKNKSTGEYKKTSWRTAILYSIPGVIIFEGIILLSSQNMFLIGGIGIFFWIVFGWLLLFLFKPLVMKFEEDVFGITDPIKIKKILKIIWLISYIIGIMATIIIFKIT